MRQAVEVTLDDQGHILIPKNIGEQMGLKPGMTLLVEQGDDEAVRLTPQAKQPTLIDEGGLLVVSGVDWFNVDTNDLIQRHREQRIFDLIERTES